MKMDHLKEQCTLLDQIKSLNNNNKTIEELVLIVLIVLEIFYISYL